MVLVIILMGVRRRRRSTSGHYGPRSCSNSAKSFGMLLSASSTQQPCMCGSFGRCICRGTTRCIETKKLVELACSHVHIVLLGATAMYVCIYIYIYAHICLLCIYIYIHTHTPLMYNMKEIRTETTLVHNHRQHHNLSEQKMLTLLRQDAPLPAAF